MSDRHTLQRKIHDLTRGRRFRGGERLEPAGDALQNRKFEYLTEQAVFAPLSSQERQWLMESTTMVTCPKGQVFHTPDEPGEVVFILKYGRVDLYRLHPDGRKIVVATLGKGSIFGEMGLIGQRMYGCFAEAIDECLICVLSRVDLQALVRRNPDVGLEILAEVGNRLQQREAELEAILFQTIPARLARLLLAEAGQYGVVEGFTHQDLAERLGTYRETVSKTLGRFKADGWIAVEPKVIRIVDREQLELLAE